jgi:ferredoxin
MRLVVDLTRCQGYGQCVFAAPEVFQMPGAEALRYESNPGDEQREKILRAAAVCPVQAIVVDQAAGRGPRPPARGQPARQPATGGS